MGVLATAELQDNLELVSLLEELLCVAKLRFIVMSTNFHAEFDLLDLAGAVLVFLLLLGELVLELTEIGDAADGRICSRGDFDQIESVGLGLADRILSFQDAELLAGGADDDADFAGANTVVDADECGINGTSMRTRFAGARGCGATRTNERSGWTTVGGLRRQGNQGDQATEKGARSYGERAVADFCFKALDECIG